MLYFDCCNAPYLLKQSPNEEGYFKIHSIAFKFCKSFPGIATFKGRSKQFNLGLPRFKFHVLEYRDCKSVQTV